MFSTEIKEIHYSLMTYLIYTQIYESLIFANIQITIRIQHSTFQLT